MESGTESCWFCKKNMSVDGCAVRVQLYRLVKDDSGAPGGAGTADHTQDFAPVATGLVVEAPADGRQHAQVPVPRCGYCRAKHARASEKGCVFAAYGAGFGFLLGVAYGILERKVTSGLIGVFFGSIIMSSVFMGLARIFVPVRGTRRKNHALKCPRVKEAQKAGWLLGVGQTTGKGTFVWTYDE